MATTTKGKGNRRTGRSKGSSARRGQISWREDNELLERVQLVADLYMEPAATIHRAVNVWLERRGRPPISQETIRLDRRRALELLHERVATGMEGHLVQLQHVLEGAWRDINRSPQGPARAPLYAIAIRAVEDMAKLDGTWGMGGVLPGAPVDEATFGPSPQQLLEAGEISREDYRAWLLVMHRHTANKTEAQPMAALAREALEDHVVEGMATVLPELAARQPQSPHAAPLRRGGAGQQLPPPPPGMPDLGDEGPRIVEWQEDDE